MDEKLKELENSLRNTYQAMSKEELIDKLVSLALEGIQESNAQIERCKKEIESNKMEIGQMDIITTVNPTGVLPTFGWWDKYPNLVNIFK